MHRRSLVIAALIAATWTNIQAQNRIPRARDGKPDLTGLWQTDRTPEREYTDVLGKGFSALQVDLHDINKNVMNLFWGLKPEQEPLTPAGAAAYKAHQDNPTAWPHTQCLPAGIPADMFVMTFKMIQAPKEILMLTELASPARQIYTDGRPLPKDPEPTWMGYSVGKWEGDTLVVDTVGLNERAWLDGFGHARSEKMHVTERFHRRDFDHMDIEFTFDDPLYYTRPFGLKASAKLIPDGDLFEYICPENEKDRAHLGK